MPFYKVSKTSGNVLAFPADLTQPWIGKVVHETDKRLTKRERKAAARKWITDRTGPALFAINWLTAGKSTLRRVNISMTIAV
jgi:hypothetical protein